MESENHKELVRLRKLTAAQDIELVKLRGELAWVRRILQRLTLSIAERVGL